MSASRAWLTPDLALGDTCRVLSLPPQFAPMVLGAIDLLTHEENWEQSGYLTPEECAEIGNEIFESVRECQEMLGMVIPYASATIPGNMLPCDGGTHLRVDWPLLYDAIDPAFIIDANTFKTPNLTGSFVRGAGATVGEVGGAAQHTLTLAETPAHNHPDPGHTHGLSLRTSIGSGGDGGLYKVEGSPTVGTTGTTFVSSPSRGSGAAHNNLPPYVALKWGIVAQ